jgi:non-heme chloroperoxidase
VPQLLPTADGVTLSVNVEGPAKANSDEPPLVLIHGWSMSGRFFRRQLPDLAARRTVIVPDLRGHGHSEKVLHGHTVPTYASDLAAILAGLGVERPVLVGWSMGAMVAYEFLRQGGPGSVSGIVIVDQPPSDFAWPGYEFGGFTAEGLLEMSEQVQTDQAGVASEFAQLMLRDPDPDTVAWMTSEILQVPPAIASAILLDQTLRDYRDLLPHIEVPALVLFGEDDKLTSPRAGWYIAEAIPAAKLKTFPNSSHCPFWEEAAAFNHAVESFLDELG